MPERPVTVHCPTCNCSVEWSERYRYRPFCSRRCKLIDLGAWLDGSHRIPGADLDDESVSTGENPNGDAQQ